MKLLLFIYTLLLSQTLGKGITSKFSKKLDNYSVNQKCYDVVISNSFSRKYSSTKFASFLDKGHHSKEDYDFTCAIKIDKEQKKKFPDWNYAARNEIAANSKKQPLSATWEPILEPVQGCNGLSERYLKTFSFLVVLDGSWVEHYKTNSRFFKKQGYISLETSPYILIDRVNFLMKKQFGIQIAARKIVSFPDLKNACKTNDHHVDDGTPSTSTEWHMTNGNIASVTSDAGIIRLGTGLPDFYCHSSSPIANGCDHEGILTSQEKIFPGDDGRFNHRSAVTLVHELGHFFGICPSGNKDCTHGHTPNDIPDIMVWNGIPANKVRPEGMFFKFFTTCSTVYKDVMCKNIQKAPAYCGVQTAKTAKYLGCFKDSVKNRALKHRRGSGSVARCTKKCKAAGYKYAGRQGKGQCWCGNNGYNKYGTKNKCKCGDKYVGKLRNCVYEVGGGDGGSGGSENNGKYLGLMQTF